MEVSLLQKYNVPVPRYTSYPTVPLWDTADTSTTRWMEHVKLSFLRNNEISLYIHLPYCEALCTYCGCNKHITKNHLVEYPYIQAVLKEWHMYINNLPGRPVIRELHLGGGTPTFFSPENLKLLIEGILELADLPESYDFSFESHPNSTTYEHLATLRELGFNRISIGVQDFDAEIMRIINRYQTIAEIRQVTEHARALGYTSINYDLIYGLPQQTPAHIERNLELLKELKPDRIAFYSYAHIPDVKKAQRAYSEADLPTGMDKLQLYTMGKEGLEALGYRDIGMDHFSLPGDELYKSMMKKKLHRNFMGYTPYHTELNIALGASAISDSYTAYAQNEKTVKEYLLRIKNEDYPPVLKTHFLTDEDRITRRKILDLICNYQANWIEAEGGIPLWIEAAYLELEKDGLVRVLNNQVQVTETGRSFIRNICRVLDVRMDSHQEKMVFSKAV